jgi:hypothetical protein
MNIILGFAELLQSDARLPARQRRFAAHIHQAGNDLFARLLGALAPAETSILDEE